MALAKRDKIRALLKSIETGDPGPAAYVNEARYIQHNPQTEEGNEGLAELFKRLSKTNPRVNIVRAFEDGDFVFGHTEYDFASRKIGFEVFRFEDGQAVEHWDNIQERRGPNADGHSMVDGPVSATDLEKGEENRETVRAFVETVLIGDDIDQLGRFLPVGGLIEHNPDLEDGLEPLASALAVRQDGVRRIDYQRLHRLLAEGNFVLSVCEGFKDGRHSAFYDLFRLEEDLIVEHWDTVEKIAPQSEWKNGNGKF
ncbi:MAG: nuclear transport factor 2 family protein [Magnetovibrionaceae bacterium]